MTFCGKVLSSNEHFEDDAGVTTVTLRMSRIMGLGDGFS